jgi:hypothetical protein
MYKTVQSTKLYTTVHDCTHIAQRNSKNKAPGFSGDEDFFTFSLLRVFDLLTGTEELRTV